MDKKDLRVSATIPNTVMYNNKRNKKKGIDRLGGQYVQSFQLQTSTTQHTKMKWELYTWELVNDSSYRPQQQSTKKLQGFNTLKCENVQSFQLQTLTSKIKKKGLNKDELIYINKMKQAFNEKQK